VGIFGPPDTLYEGGYFKADMEFPTTYPFAPPKVNKSFRIKKSLTRRLLIEKSK
jgi:ubiquitin-protein ligase